jgi:uncharacterized membrane protein YkvA (DUF1232 family)
MAIRISSWLSRPSTMRSLYQQLKLAVRLLREPRVPAPLKAIPGLALVYTLSPVDFIPDILPVIGQLDDLAVLAFTLQLFIRMCPNAVQTFHRDAIAEGRPYEPMPARDNVIDGKWRRE